MTPWFNRFLFLSRLFGINVSIPRPHAEFWEFRLLIQRLRFGGDPNLILELMLNASINKRNCTDSKSWKDAKKLSEDTLQMLNKLEKSGVIIDNSIRFRVLEHNVSYYASEGQREANYKLTNRFQVAVRLFSNRSQRTSKCGKNISDTLYTSVLQ